MLNSVEGEGTEISGADESIGRIQYLCSDRKMGATVCAPSGAVKSAREPSQRNLRQFSR